jgi:hypothetical protein
MTAKTSSVQVRAMPIRAMTEGVASGVTAARHTGEAVSLGENRSASGR